MAIVRMKKLTLVGMLKHQQNLLDALISTQCVQLSTPSQQEGCSVVLDTVGHEKLADQANRVEDALSYIGSTVEQYNTDYKKELDFAPVKLPHGSIARPLREMTHSQFLAVDLILDKVMQDVVQLEELRSTIITSHASINNLVNDIARLGIYSKLPKPLDSYTDTANTVVMVGTVPKNNLGAVRQLVTLDTMAEVELVGEDSDNSAIMVVAHNSEQAFISGLSSLGFAKCGIRLSVPTSEHIKQLYRQIKQYNKTIKLTIKEVVKMVDIIPELKLVSDYLDVELAKVDANGAMPSTSSTFVMEGFFPAPQEPVVLSAINSVSDNIMVYIDEVPQDETAPIMYDNNKLVSNFETVTNMYTPPSYHEVDPNPVMSFFYFIIFGMMVADIGYGLILALIGLIGKFGIKQKTGIRQLMTLFGLCGLSAVGVGALYGSAFSYPLYTGVIPDASIYPKTTMVICLLFGLFHLSAGFVLSFVQRIKDRQYLLGYGVSLMWAVFFVGLFVALLQPALAFMDYPTFNSVVLPPIVGNIGLVVVGVSLLVVVICAGGSGKVGIGKRVMSGLGSLYGILNYFGDVMSYIRIFGLMLSNAMMGVVINDLGVMVAGNGGILGTIMSVALLVFAHLFNLVIGILGVYIHNGRLQYVEFFGKFYQGDGEMFTPFGGNNKYTLLVDSNTAVKQRKNKITSQAKAK